MAFSLSLPVINWIMQTNGPQIEDCGTMAESSLSHQSQTHTHTHTLINKHTHTPYGTEKTQFTVQIILWWQSNAFLFKYWLKSPVSFSCHEPCILCVLMCVCTQHTQKILNYCTFNQKKKNAAAVVLNTNNSSVFHARVCKLDWL